MNDDGHFVGWFDLLSPSCATLVQVGQHLPEHRHEQEFDQKKYQTEHFENDDGEEKITKDDLRLPSNGLLQIALVENTRIDGDTDVGLRASKERVSTLVREQFVQVHIERRCPYGDELRQFIDVQRRRVIDNWSQCNRKANRRSEDLIDRCRVERRGELQLSQCVPE